MSDSERYTKAMHAMQSGVAAYLARDARAGQSKHLIVGNNARAVDQAGLVKLLIAKGVFTEEEYLKAIADEMDSEVARWEEKLSDMLGRKITLA